MYLAEALEFLTDYYIGSDRFDIDALVNDLIQSPPFLKEWDVVIRQAIMQGTIHPNDWDAVAPSCPLSNFYIAFGKLWNALTERGIVEPLRGGRQSGNLTIWAYVDEWTFSDQDEDLLLTEMEHMPPLLEAATDETCPKRYYCLSLVKSAVRCHAAMYAGTSQFPKFLEQCAALLTIARRTDDQDLTSYLERLQTYGRPATVDYE